MDAGSEDAVFYSIYADFVLEKGIDVLSELERVRVECLAVIAPLVQGYIWQHTQFDLQAAVSAPYYHKESPFSTYEFDNSGELCAAPSSASSADLPLLFGRTRYGHNLEDEWFVVYLLFEISRRVPNVSIRLWDTDGEFLLIEAAYAIPRWLKPENSQNRVFIRGGAVHILQMPTSPAHVGLFLASPTLSDSLMIMSSGIIDTRASDTVQEAIGRKLAGFPERAMENMHRVRCRVPLRVAQVVKHEPQMVALAVEAFYTRDHDAMRAASKMEKFLTQTTDGEPEMVTILVCMSKAMYAQLKQQVFQAPKTYPMPRNPTPEDEIGLKLSCGFEMMYWERSRFQDEEEHSMRAFWDDDAGWKSFRKSLESSGYFKSLLEGSKEHRELMEAARGRYRQTDTFSRIRAAMQAPAKRIDEILELKHGMEDFADVALSPSDDDTWLYRGDEELTTTMDERQKEMDAYESQRKSKSKSKEQQFDPDQLTNTMKSFVDKMSSFEGAEVPPRDEVVSMDLDKFLHELKSALKMEGESADNCDTASSDDMDFSGDDENEVNNSDEFIEEYSEALSEELNKSSVSKTFKDEEDTPVDVDLNLVKNMLESYSSQQGLPGPASNILGMMGLELPDNKDSKTVKKKNMVTREKDMQAQDVEKQAERDDRDSVVHRAPWLRALLLGADDGLVSVASLLLGVSAGTENSRQLMLSGIAGLIAGACSMAVGEYVSVSSQRDTEVAEVERERRRHMAGGDAAARELEELAQIYVSRGLSYDLARQVAVELSREGQDLVKVHAREELGIDVDALSKPWQAAAVSAVAFTTGGAVPLLSAGFVKVYKLRLVAIAVSTTLGLVAFGVFAALLGRAPVIRAGLRVTIGGWIAMLITFGVLYFSYWSQ